ncbi:hypothetical protein SETIT_8G046200v2 [Setaria italica]|uniref:Annexin n=1 Tax=Setaria italica TaxID=4555 RepID=A0A368S464_SETIT|nr:hypothetical protein SETIT_8G046200v2 [Setaria italica]
MATYTVPQVVPSPAEDAAALLKAFQGWGTDEQAVIAILAHRDAAQRKRITLKYEEMYHESLMQRLKSELSGDFEVNIIHEAARNGLTDNEELIWIVGTKSKGQLIASFSCFDYEHALLPGGTDPTGYLRALRTAWWCIAVLRNATFESGTDEDSLTRVVVMHAEKDMKGISSAFRRRSSVTLEQAIAKETSGDYRSFLMALLGS